ncbi:hypothetical protein VCRA2116O427_370021 [Vibrio crassostreae]|nr:hypothetical protein VCRA2119O432_370021 [Vibrio crassostreae]CAK2042712.1 hypothetical protein VCRA2113O413_370021 [Vibrio crassostreae]CAK2043512.1 hypothetical protein VCRA2118O429_360021 [Vibrio crassostreae]CAK2044484.1 hypothetical protein VCRA2114O423_370021 [Vibrio crassostreae]CAK2046629.1 hypothetical protein VCRA2114O421_380005 [Vibrio crassostreae]
MFFKKFIYVSYSHLINHLSKVGVQNANLLKIRQLIYSSLMNERYI